jgi:methionyl-tRNA formyltransferase
MKSCCKTGKIIIATTKQWNIYEAKRFISTFKRLKVLIITGKEELAYERIARINPEFIFFPHWSWKIPKEIFKNYKCIVFHMTDLPYGRGGSPLQNLISRGIEKTKISAIEVTMGLDEGPIYTKRSLKLSGSAQDIYIRASKIIFGNMIPYIIKNCPNPVKQKGKVVVFKRRVPSQSNLKTNKSLKSIYDQIRMLDAEGYPNAFLDAKDFTVKFRCANMKRGKLAAKAEFEVKND